MSKEVGDKIIQTAKEALETIGWSYSEDTEKQALFLGVQGNDLPIRLIIYANSERESVVIRSSLPVTFSEKKRVEGAAAICMINWPLAVGHFGMNFGDGEVVYELSNLCKNGEIPAETIVEMIQYSTYVVDEYNDKLSALATGYMTIQQLQEIIMK